VQGYAKELLSALEHMHNASIIHCDIKPQNIMLTMSNSAKLADFGTAQIVGQDDDTISNARGTYEFLAPECCSSEK